MLKRLIKILAVLVILLVVAVVGGFIYIDTIARNGVEYAATRALGVKTSVGSMDVSIFGSRVEMDNLAVQNPQGYEAHNFLELDKGQIAVSLATLTKQEIVVPTLRLDGLDLYLEKKGGKANYQVIIDNLALEPVPPEDAKKFFINELRLTNITVHANLLPVGGELTRKTIKIPEIHLVDVGSENAEGVALEKLSGIIIQAIMEAVVRNGGDLPLALVAELGTNLGKLEAIPAKGLKVLDDTGKELQQSLDKATKGLAEDIGKSLDSLLGGRKTKDEQKKATPAPAPQAE